MLRAEVRQIGRARPARKLLHHLIIRIPIKERELLLRIWSESPVEMQTRNHRRFVWDVNKPMCMRSGTFARQKLVVGKAVHHKKWIKCGTGRKDSNKLIFVATARGLGCKVWAGSSLTVSHTKMAKIRALPY